MKRRRTIEELQQQFMDELYRYVRNTGSLPEVRGHIEFNEAFALLGQRIKENTREWRRNRPGEESWRIRS